MSSKRQLIVVVGAFGALAAAVAVTKLLREPAVRRRLGLPHDAPRLEGDGVDEASEESFPASDAPSFTPITSIGGSH